MKNDLISRKALLEIFEHDLACFESKDRKETEMFISVADMRRMIAGAPTAYNPEKVVQQLEDKKNELRKEYHLGKGNLTLLDGNIRGIEDALGIVCEQLEEKLLHEVCPGCGYLKDNICTYKGTNCMVSRPAYEAIKKAFADVLNGGKV